MKKWSPRPEKKFNQTIEDSTGTLEKKLCFDNVTTDQLKFSLGPAASKPVLIQNQNSTTTRTTCESSNKSSDASATDGEFVNNVKILDHLKSKEPVKKQNKETEIDCCKMI